MTNNNPYIAINIAGGAEALLGPSYAAVRDYYENKHGERAVTLVRVIKWKSLKLPCVKTIETGPVFSLGPLTRRATQYIDIDLMGGDRNPKLRRW